MTPATGAGSSGRALLLRSSTDGALRRLSTMSPNRWRGEGACAVGPFSSRQVAETFARVQVARRLCRDGQLRVFACRDAWYVEVCQRAGDAIRRTWPTGRR